ncbi:MAG TPA: S41 family peptidase [Thermoanaerobaculia bacterium]
MMTKKKVVFLSLSVALMVTLLTGAVFGQVTQKSSIFRYLSIFSEVLDLVRTNYVEPVASDKLMEGAFAGVTDAIDEFSYYVPPAQMAAYKQFSDVDDNRLGLVVTKRFGYAYVIAPVKGSPAEKAGIARGDFIEKIDGATTQNMPVWQVRSLLQRNQPVTLQVLRGGETQREQVSIKPESFRPVTLETDTISGIGYIRIPYFDKGTAEQFRVALNDVRSRNIRKIIVDVRGNAGGNVEEAISAADALLTSGLITSLAGRKVEEKRWQATRDTAFDGELQILTDSGTASGAELFAAAVRGNNRGKIVGVTTYGRAIEQRFVTLPSGGGVQMTIARYTTPDLKMITNTGVRPDVIVDLSSQSLEDSKEERAKPKDDLILNKALQLFGAEPPVTEVEQKAA